MKQITREQQKNIARNLYGVMATEVNNDPRYIGSTIMMMLSVYLCECHHNRRPGVDGEKLVDGFFDILKADVYRLIAEKERREEEEEEIHED